MSFVKENRVLVIKACNNIRTKLPLPVKAFKDVVLPNSFVQWQHWQFKKK